MNNLIPPHSMGGAPLEDGMQLATHPHFYEDGTFAHMHHTPLHMYVRDTRDMGLDDRRERQQQVHVLFAENREVYDEDTGESDWVPVVTGHFLTSYN
jgi:hypothetical protein